MARRRKTEDSGGSGDWLTTYSDMVTLLLTFFIMLFAMSSVDAEKWQRLVKSFSRTGDETSQIVLVPEGSGNDIGANHGEVIPPEEDIKEIDLNSKVPQNFDELYYYIKSYVDKNDMEGSVEIQKSDNSVFIRFKDNIFFGSDSAVLKSSGLHVLNYLGDCLKAVEKQLLSIRINGHTAAVPGISNYHVSDRTLSSDRANSVLIYFEKQKLIEPKKLISIGYGKNYPVASNNTQEGREKNRRVDIMILSNDIDFSNSEALYKLLQESDIDYYLEEQGINEAKAMPKE